MASARRSTTRDRMGEAVKARIYNLGDIRPGDHVRLQPSGISIDVIRKDGPAVLVYETDSGRYRWLHEVWPVLACEAEWGKP